MERDELRERIARALHDSDHPGCDWLADEDWQVERYWRQADAVLAALSGEPAPTEPRRKFTDHGAFDPWHEPAATQVAPEPSDEWVHDLPALGEDD